MIGSQFRNYAEIGPRTATTSYGSRTSPQGIFRPKSEVPRLLACIDDGEMAKSVSAQALAIACSLGMEVTFARVIDAPGQFASPADPIEWQLRRRTQQEDLRRFSGQEEGQVITNRVLLAGTPADELSDWALDHGATLLATGRRRFLDGRGMGSTARSLLERGEHSLLIVPPGQPRKGPYRRIMVPIDGSGRGDAVLPVARRIARTHGADLMLIHIVPPTEILETVNAPQLHRLSNELDEQKRRHGKNHLEELRSRSIEDGLEVETILRGPGDPRSMLRDAAISEDVDLIVMASHGATGLSDVACGSVTKYLAEHAPAPLLIVRPNLRCSFGPKEKNCRNPSVFRFDE